MPPLDDATALGDAAEIGLSLRYRIISAELRAHGIDGNCSPLGDIARVTTHPVLKNRCYGTTVADVTGRARAVANATLESGVLPVLKHIPGHGRASLDSHLDLPCVDTDLAQLRQTDFAVFRALSNLPIGMTAHLRFDAIDDQPVTFSRPAITMIREDIGFDGLLLTDDISMEALSGTIVQRGTAALDAGCDIILHCNGRLDEMTALAKIATPTSATITRMQQVLTLRSKVQADAKKVDIRALSEEFAALHRRTG